MSDSVRRMTGASMPSQGQKRVAGMRLRRVVFGGSGRVVDDAPVVRQMYDT